MPQFQWIMTIHPTKSSKTTFHSGQRASLREACEEVTEMFRQHFEMEKGEEIDFLAFLEQSRKLDDTCLMDGKPMTGDEMEKHS